MRFINLSVVTSAVTASCSTKNEVYKHNANQYEIKSLKQISINLKKV